MQSDAERQLQAAVKAGGGKAARRQRRVVEERAVEADQLVHRAPVVPAKLGPAGPMRQRSEGRRVGNECVSLRRYRWSPAPLATKSHTTHKTLDNCNQLTDN